MRSKDAKLKSLRRPRKVSCGFAEVKTGAAGLIVPTLRKSRRVGQPLYTRCQKSPGQPSISFKRRESFYTARRFKTNTASWRRQRFFPPTKGMVAACFIHNAN